MAETNPVALTAYCGLDCGKCFGYTKTVSEAAKQLRRTMRAERMKQVWPSMPFLGNYDAFKKDLDALAGLRCKGLPGRRREPLLPDKEVRPEAKLRRLLGVRQVRDLREADHPRAGAQG